MARRVLLGILVLGIAAALAWWFLRDDLAGLTPAPIAPSTAAEAPGIPDDAFEMTVESVHDGDTLRAHVAVPNEVVTTTESTRVRLLGIDTPEISPAVECWGAEATAALTALAPAGSTIWAAADRDAFDQYGRTLLYLWTPDGVFINAALVSGGAARVEIYSPNDEFEALLRDLESQAQTADAGRWGACG